MPVDERGPVTPGVIAEAARRFGTPLYLYDAAHVTERCRQLLAMPNAFGLEVRYAMKANSARALLQLIARSGIGIDASSLNEARRARLSGIPCERIMLTTQEVPEGADREELERLMSAGLRYNACSWRQLELIADFAVKARLPLAIRVNPGAGTGESVTRNTGDKYSSFGIHLEQMDRLTAFVRERGVVVDGVHSHIGSGGDPAQWRDNIDRMLEITERWFPQAQTVCLGGGFREARMPDEQGADIEALGAYAQQRFREFATRTGRQLQMAIEPGTYLVANAGYLVTRVADRKWSGPGGFDFVILDGGMESITRPLLYGSRHPFYVVSSDGTLRSSEHDLSRARGPLSPKVVVGRCCESGDSQTLDADGHVVPREMAEPSMGDHVVIGGAGAYCSSMSLVNYNSYLQAPEVLLDEGGALKLIRRRQTFEEMLANELPL